MRTQEETPFYIRTEGGNTFFVETLEEAVKEMASDDGYRLGIISGDLEITIRRSSIPNEFNESEKYRIASFDASVVITQTLRGDI